MKNAKIITINDYCNYGNRLQSYALYTYMNKYIPTRTIWFISSHKRIKDFIKLFFPINKEIRRYNKFHIFTKRYIKPLYIQKKSIKKYENDIFITGSDQVWNSTFGTFSDEFLLPFAKFKNSYAASFGYENIPQNDIELFKRNLQQFENISVREEKGIELINELQIKKDVEVVLDPTMMLSSNEWEKLIHKKKLNYEYVLVFFIGKISDENIKKIYDYSKKKNYKVINLLDVNDKNYCCSPSDFLFLEKNAKMIFTDSFHSTVFSIIFNKPFIVFPREDNLVKMNSRIDTLLNTFKLKNRLYCNNKIDDYEKIDYTIANEIMKKKREESDLFIKKIISFPRGEDNE